MGSIACTEPYCVFAFIDFGAMQIQTKMNTVQRIQNNSAVVVFKRYIANPFARHTNKYTLLRSSDFYRATADENEQKKLVSTRLFTTFTLFDILYVWCRDCNRIHKKKMRDGNNRSMERFRLYAIVLFHWYKCIFFTSFNVSAFQFRLRLHFVYCHFAPFLCWSWSTGWKLQPTFPLFNDLLHFDRASCTSVCEICMCICNYEIDFRKEAKKQKTLRM